jgi:hypothetical protein
MYPWAAAQLTTARSAGAEPGGLGCPGVQVGLGYGLQQLPGLVSPAASWAAARTRVSGHLMRSAEGRSPSATRSCSGRVTAHRAYLRTATWVAAGDCREDLRHAAVVVLQAGVPGRQGPSRGQHAAEPFCSPPAVVPAAASA